MSKFFPLPVYSSRPSPLWLIFGIHFYRFNPIAGGGKANSKQQARTQVPGFSSALRPLAFLLWNFTKPPAGCPGRKKTSLVCQELVTMSTIFLDLSKSKQHQKNVKLPRASRKRTSRDHFFASMEVRSHLPFEKRNKKTGAAGSISIQGVFFELNKRYHDWIQLAFHLEM